MALLRLHLQMATLIGGNARITSEKDMEHLSGLMEGDILGSTCRVLNMALEYSDGQVEVYIKDNSNKIKEKVMHIRGVQMAMSIMDSTRMIRGMEKESIKTKAYYTELNMKMTKLSAQ